MPLYQHNCNNCTYLGDFNNTDLYFHGGIYPTVIARYSSEGSDYASGLQFGRVMKDDPTSEIGEAYRRAKKLNLVKN